MEAEMRGPSAAVAAPSAESAGVTSSGGSRARLEAEMSADIDDGQSVRVAATRFAALPYPNAATFDPSTHLEELNGLLLAYKTLSHEKRRACLDNKLIVDHTVSSLRGLLAKNESLHAAAATATTATTTTTATDTTAAAAPPGLLQTSLQLSALGQEALLHLIALRTLELVSELAFAVDCANQTKLRELGIPSVVLACMRHGPGSDDWDVQEMGAIALRCLARAGKNIVAIAAGGGIHRILTCMRDHSGVPTLQIEGFKALFNLAFNSDNQNAIVVATPASSFYSTETTCAAPSASSADDGLSIIMSAIERHAGNALVQEFGCNLIHNLVFKNSRNKELVATRGCIRTVVETSMSNHLTSANVQIEACRTLLSLGFSRACQDIVLAVGGIEQIFQTLAALREDKIVTVEVFKVLCTLALNHAENKQAIIQGIDHILVSMRHHAGIADVQGEGCAVLATLSFRNAEHKKVISNSGGIDAIVAAMRTHRDTGGVQVDACKALASLAFDAALQVEIAEKGGVEAIVSAMKRHQWWSDSETNGAGNSTSKGIVSMTLSRAQRKGCMRVQSEGAKALSELAYRLEDNKIRITKAGGIEALMEAMACPEVRVSRIPLESFRALFSLAICADSKKRMVAIGVIPFVISVMRAQARISASVQDHGCRLLAELMFNNKRHVEIVRRSGGVSAIFMGVIENSNQMSDDPAECNGLNEGEEHGTSGKTTTMTLMETATGEVVGTSSGGNVAATDDSSAASRNRSLEDRAKRALDYFDARTLLDALLGEFAKADDSIRIQRILRLFVIVRSRMDKNNGADASEDKTDDDGQSGEEDEEEVEVENVVEGKQNVPGSVMNEDVASLDDEEVREKVIAVGRRLRSSLPEIWNRSVAKRFGSVLRMFKSRKEDSTSNPPSPCRATVRGIERSVYK